MNSPSLLDRSHYPSLSESVYLNQASLGLIGQPAVAAMHTFIEAVARHGNLRMSDLDEMEYCRGLRECAAKLFHDTTARVAVVASASEMLGQLPLLLRLKSDTTVLAVSTDFPAITRPWLRQAALGLLSVRFVNDVPGRDLTDTLIDAIDEDTGVIALSHVQYSTGTRVEISRLRKIAQQVGAFLVVDATQSAGAMHLDTAAWGADAVVASGYKWLGGHGGAALAVISPSLLQQLPPLPGWMSAPRPFEFDATSVLFSSDARRFTQSTMSYVSIAGLTASLEQLLSIGDVQIEDHARRLASILVDGMRNYGWKSFRDVRAPGASPHIISLGHREQCATATVAKLRNQRIICSDRGGRVRVSLAPYNDIDDVHALIEALAGSVAV